jgi:hypothetical protein
MSDEEHKVRSLQCFLQFPVTSFLWSQNIILNALFSKTLNMCVLLTYICCVGSSAIDGFIHDDSSLWDIYFNILPVDYLLPAQKKTLFEISYKKELRYLSQFSVWLQTGPQRFDPRQRRKDFSSRLSVHTGSEAHPASCPMGTGGKARPGCDADHSPPSSADVKNE